MYAVNNPVVKSSFLDAYTALLGHTQAIKEEGLTDWLQIEVVTTAAALINADDPVADFLREAKDAIEDVIPSEKRIDGLNQMLGLWDEIVELAAMLEAREVDAKFTSAVGGALDILLERQGRSKKENDRARYIWAMICRQVGAEVKVNRLQNAEVAKDAGIKMFFFTALICAKHSYREIGTPVEQVRSVISDVESEITTGTEGHEGALVNAPNAAILEFCNKGELSDDDRDMLFAEVDLMKKRLEIDFDMDRSYPYFEEGPEHRDLIPGISFEKSLMYGLI